MTEKTRAQFTDHQIEESNTFHPYCLICGTSIEHHPIATMPTSDEIQYETMEDVVREEIEENESDEIASDEEVDQWFIERASEFEFHPFVTTCSMCFKREAFYVGVTQHGTPFEFCRICRDDLVRRADAAKQSPERFGV